MHIIKNHAIILFFESLIKSIFEKNVRGAHLSIVNSYKDALSSINEKVNDVDDKIKISLVDKSENEKLKAGDNNIKIKFVDESNNQFIFEVVLEGVQSTGFLGTLIEKYHDNPIFEVADHVADAFGIQKLDTLYNLTAFGLLQKANNSIKSTGHHIIDKIKYKQEYSNNPDDDINKSREHVKTDTQKTGFLSKIKNKLRFKKNDPNSETSNFYAANSNENSNTFEIPVTNTKDNTSETFKVNIQMKSAEETNKEHNN